MISESSIIHHVAGLFHDYCSVAPLKGIVIKIWYYPHFCHYLSTYDHTTAHPCDISISIDVELVCNNLSAREIWHAKWNMYVIGGEVVKTIMSRVCSYGILDFIVGEVQYKMIYSLRLECRKVILWYYIYCSLAAHSYSKFVITK